MDDRVVPANDVSKAFAYRADAFVAALYELESNIGELEYDNAVWALFGLTREISEKRDQWIKELNAVSLSIG